MTTAHNQSKFKYYPWRRYKRYRRLTAGMSVLLVASIIVQIFIIWPGAAPTRAEDVLLCLKICASGSGSCTFGVCADSPSVSTQAVTSITSSTATGHGTVLSDGGDTITEVGTVTATSQNPTTSDIKDIAGVTTGSYTTAIDGLSAATGYYTRAYAANGAGIGYGEQVTFTTSETTSGTTGSGSGSGPGGAPPKDTDKDKDKEPPKKEPKPWSELLVPNVGPGDRGLVVLENVYDYKSGRGVPTTDAQGRLKLSHRRPSFKGRTNIKNARIFVTVASEVQYGTTAADEQGHWDWTTIIDLEDGEHAITIQAVSPEDGTLTDTRSYNFVITSDEIQAVPPGGTGAPPATIEWPSGTSGQSAADIITQYLYSVDVSVEQPPDQPLTSTQQLDVKTDIISFSPETISEVNLNFHIYNSLGEKIYSEKKTVVVKDKLTDLSRLVVPQGLPADTYIVAVELSEGGQIFVSTEIFEIHSPVLLSTPALTVSAADLALALRVISALLAGLLLLFAWLTYQEYRRVQRALRRIVDHDLLNSGMIS